MDDVELEKRTKVLALSVFKLVGALPSSTTGQVVAKQIVRCASNQQSQIFNGCAPRVDRLHRQTCS